MTLRDNILEELKALNSQLAGYPLQNTYSVPEGYFEGLIGQVMQRIRALEATNAAGELEVLSPLLAQLSKQLPYQVPAGYFENLDARIRLAIAAETEEISLLAGLSQESTYTVPVGYFDGLADRMLAIVKSSDHASAQDETAAISPLLGSLKKQMPYEVPAGYFEKLASNMAAKESATEAKVIAISHRSWFRYAAAAVITGVIFMAGFLLMNQKTDQSENGVKVFAKVSDDIKKLNDTQNDDLIDFLNAGMTGNETAQVTPNKPSNEIQQLLQDVSEEELKDFREQTEDLGEVLMTN